MKKTQISKAIKFGMTVESFYKYGYRWWGIIANEMVDRIGCIHYNNFCKAYHKFADAPTDEAYAEMIATLAKLQSAILHSGALSMRRFQLSEAYTSTGRKVGLYELTKRMGTFINEYRNAA